jgi:hypothetical protein
MSNELFPEVLLFRDNSTGGMLSVISEFVYWTINTPISVTVEITLSIGEVRDSNLSREKVLLHLLFS